MAQELTDDEWNAVQDDLRTHLKDFRSAYEDEANKNEVRKETDEYIVFADASGHELREIAEIVGVDRSALSRRMHEEARKRYSGDGVGDAWSVADPIVVIKE